MYMWPFWSIPSYIISLATAALIFLYSIINHNAYDFSVKRLWLVLLLLCVAAYNGTAEAGFSRVLGTLVNFVPVIFLLVLSADKQNDVLKSVSKWFAWLLVPGMILFILRLIVNFPSVGSLYFSETQYGEFLNYIFYIKDNYSGDIPRFNGPFIEPGHLGMICSLFLFANKFDFKRKSVWIILAASLISLSLAAYVLMFIGVVLIYARDLRKLIALAFVLIAAVFIIGKVWNGGDNIVSKLIFSRLKYDEEKIISGNNRSLYQTDYYYEEFRKEGALRYGIGAERFNEMMENKQIGGAGYKMYVLPYGYAGVFLIALFYFMTAWFAPDRKYGLSFFVLIVAAFQPQEYVLWMAWLLPYITATGSSGLITNDEKNEEYGSDASL